MARAFGSGLVQFPHSSQELLEILRRVFLATNSAEKGGHLAQQLLVLQIRRDLATGDCGQIRQFHPLIVSVLKSTP